MMQHELNNGLCKDLEHRHGYLDLGHDLVFEATSANTPADNFFLDFSRSAKVRDSDGLLTLAGWHLK